MIRTAEDDGCRVCSQKQLDETMGWQIAMMSDGEILRKVIAPEPSRARAIVFTKPYDREYKTSASQWQAECKKTRPLARRGFRQSTFCECQWH